MVLEANISLVVVDLTGMTNFLVKKILLCNLTPLSKLYCAWILFYYTTLYRDALNKKPNTLYTFLFNIILPMLKCEKNSTEITQCKIHCTLREN